MKRGALLILRRGTSFCFSRDENDKFLNDCYDRKIYEFDPFARFITAQTVVKDMPQAKHRQPLESRSI